MGDGVSVPQYRHNFLRRVPLPLLYGRVILPFGRILVVIGAWDALRGRPY